MKDLISECNPTYKIPPTTVLFLYTNKITVLKSTPKKHTVCH